MKSYESLFKGQSQGQSQGQMQGQMQGQGKIPMPSCGCDSVKGNSVQVELNSGDCEVRADVIVGRTNGVRVWGRVKDCEGRGVAYALVKLVKVVHYKGMLDVEGVAHTMTDCAGFYQFEIDNCEIGAKYRILVHKAATGGERRIPDTDNLCNPCVPPVPCNPVEPYEPCQHCE